MLTALSQYSISIYSLLLQGLSYFSTQILHSSSEFENAFTNYGLYYFASRLEPCLDSSSCSSLDGISFFGKDVPSSENILALTAARHRM